jgi:probable H4MPT-linked C1 transfer pathway protein
MRAEPTVGWDLGGAHLKVAAVDASGRVQTALQFPCPLWQGLPELDRALQLALAHSPAARWHAVTMTGELVDLFRDRAAGVTALIGRFGAHVPLERTLVFASDARFLSAAQAVKKSDAVASANWLAAAAVVAQHVADALFVDIGSTTTDIVPICANAVRAEGATDAERLACEELVYTGVVRTPIMALVDRIPFAGTWIEPMAEHFATTADVYRLTGELSAGADQLPSADNGEKTVRASARRLARMVGRDGESASPPAWRKCARYLADVQLWRVQQACERVLSRVGMPSRVSLIGAGTGRFLVRKLALRLGCRYRDFGELVARAGPDREWVANCAPAVAVALLAQQRRKKR